MIVLYSTLGCHLCDEAIAIIHPLLKQDETCTVVDIAEEDALVESYGTRIPVVKHERSGGEIGWPFTADEFVVWLEQQHWIER